MPAPANIVGQRFGRLVAVEPLPAAPSGRKWKLLCDCGAYTASNVGNLRSGNTRSCGCLERENSIARIRAAQPLSAALARTHGDNRSTEYATWASMIQRCTNRRNPNFPRYGGRGITVCERWRDYAQFIADMGRKPTPEHSIDRIDVNGNYEPGNCRWATKREQALNRRPRARKHTLFTTE